LIKGEHTVTQAAQTYEETSISTQDKGKLVVMLYEGAIKYLKVARRELEDGDYATKGTYIGKAQDIISELNNSLDMEVGGELARDLRSLYNFIYGRLSTANIERDVEKIDDCIRLLRQLHGAWEQAARETAGQRQETSRTNAGRSFQA
jgi:flagellar protein FliS